MGILREDEYYKFLANGDVLPRQAGRFEREDRTGENESGVEEWRSQTMR